ncbi:sulfatase-like hydrolase/transferase [Tamlana sp. 2201CG12-4]|uniref:sulfatase family protein n=1 Tax=Tamlana sp. 2201CG12-4 TaxID=3112582 RepID=UPI002DBBF083|nr:sulfatase-like hydrolase/transferase [Tamlana sp. 2201CG12-4]MEC3908407.1 sulfatase-like hydrolase/transferase [Tamlana sp. 2201CG12-4]
MNKIFYALLIFCGTNLVYPQKMLPERPNIILIMTDDQGWFDAGFNGNSILQTPHLDALASKGIIFDRFYSASAVCSPTRASVVTGRNPYRMEIPGANTGHLKTQEITIAELLKKEGYATGHFGKWHLGIHTKKEPDANRGGREKHFKHYSIPSMHGYDEYFCTESKVPTYDPMAYPEEFKNGESKRYGWSAIKKGEKAKDFNTAYWVGDEQKAEGELSGDDTKLIMDRVVSFIERSLSQGEPFFATVWTHSPHLPVVTSDYYKSKYPDLSNKEQLYYGCITALDDQIGRLWKELERNGTSENTMIWFCSDNGPENETPGSAGHLKGRKRSLYEGGLRTPAFVVWERELKGKKRLDVPAFTSDYLPTLLSVLNIDYPDDRPIDGINLMPFIKKTKKERNKPMGFRLKNQISWVNHRYKLITKDNGNNYELYDIIADEGEEKNIAAFNSKRVEEMKSELNTWLSSVENSSKERDY